MPVFEINPLTDKRWNDLLEQNPRASVFHAANWLKALEQTYAYEPLAFTTSAPGKPLENALVFCRVKSWITGRRLVSLPFSDHCDLLAESGVAQQELVAHACGQVVRKSCSCLELRPASAGDPSWPKEMNLRPAKAFCLHRLPLDVPLDSLFRNLHENCIRRKIRRAEKENLVYESGASEALLARFYELFLRTRRRHCLPPQPLRWFRKLAELMGEKLNIRLVSRDDRPLAAMLTLSHKTTVTYKYGCSDERFHNLGGMQFLFWKTIEESKNDGMRVLDLGRSDQEQKGLIEFKDRLGAVKTDLTYWRYPGAKAAVAARRAWGMQLARSIFSLVPDPIFVASGNFLYRHMG